MSRRLVDTIRRKRSQLLVESVSIESIFPPYSSDTESGSSSESNELCPRLSCSIDEIFPPARSPSQSDSSGNYEEIFPTDHFISTSSRCTFGEPQKVAILVLFKGVNNARTKLLQIAVDVKCDKCLKKAMRIAIGLSGVQSAAIIGHRDQIEVKGERIDTVKLVTLLRKKVGHASILSIAEEKKEEKEDEKKDELSGYEHDTPSCSIM
ncbi:uncharacterized protein LOC142617635 [Castanea sativa]|uniref:uncharacterized protein LOC142617635 n=1 Tax=Castanea sativa TaxID=21020 RepID=UPI003F64BDE9